jgi:aryl-alcohol dehydrogenase-like predicted oxidoreductase
MDYLRLGNSGLMISRLTMGAMTFGGAGARGFRANVHQSTANRMVAAALDAGINLFDTADVYSVGASEEMLGRALSAAGAEGALVATKVGNRMSPDRNDRGLSYRHVVSSCEASLRRLGREAIDLYQLHMPDFQTPLEETLRALDDLRRRGLVRYVGWSNFPAWYAAKAQGLQANSGQAPFVSAQVYYSLVGRELELEVLPSCRDAGVGVLVWSPLAGGYLSGKYSSATPDGGGGRRASFDFPPVDKVRGEDVLASLRSIASELGRSPSQVALAWLLHQRGITSVIVGASSPEQLEQNLGAAEVQLTREALEALDDASRIPLTYPHWLFGRPAATDDGELVFGLPRASA